MIAWAVVGVGDLIIVSELPLFSSLFYFLLIYSQHREVKILCHEFLEVLTQQNSLSFSKPLQSII